MEWLGLVCLGLVLCSSSYPGRVKRLEHKFKRIKNNKKDKKVMKLISDLIGKRGVIETDDPFSADNICDILDADDEWVKIRYKDKRKNVKTKIIRIDSIESVELLENEEVK